MGLFFLDSFHSFLLLLLWFKEIEKRIKWKSQRDSLGLWKVFSPLIHFRNCLNVEVYLAVAKLILLCEQKDTKEKVCRRILEGKQVDESRMMMSIQHQTVSLNREFYAMSPIFSDGADEASVEDLGWERERGKRTSYDWRISNIFSASKQDLDLAISVNCDAKRKMAMGIISPLQLS